MLVTPNDCFRSTTVQYLDRIMTNRGLQLCNVGVRDNANSGACLSNTGRRELNNGVPRYLSTQ